MPLREPYLPEDPRIERVLFTERQIQERVAALAAQIAADYQDRDALHILGILNGAFVFAADLARALRRAGAPPAVYDFIRARLYGRGLKDVRDGAAPCDVRITALPPDLDGRDVLLVEDILDRGFTLARVRDYLLRETGAGSARICVLLDKDLDAPSADVIAVRRALRPEYVGFRVPDRWVAGYGLDAAGYFRDLPCIVVVREAFFR